MYRKLITLLLLAIPCSITAQEQNEAVHQEMGHESEHHEAETGTTETQGELHVEKVSDI